MQNNRLASLINIWNSISKRNKILIIATLTMVLAAVPLTIVQSLQQQETRQRASHIATLKAYSDKNSYDIRDEFSVDIDLDINLESSGKDISAADVIIEYDKNLLELVSLGETDFIVIAPQNSQIQNNSGSIHFVGIRMKTGVLSQLRVTTLKLRALEKTGKTNISFLNATITASGQSGIISPEMEPKTISITKDEFRECVYESIRNGKTEDIARNICKNIQNANGNNNGQSSVQSKSLIPIFTSQTCTSHSEAFAICKTPPNGNILCWLTSCSIEGNNPEGTTGVCSYQLNPLLKDDDKCSSLWTSSNATAPASTTTATPTPTPSPTPTSNASFDNAGYSACVAPCNNLENDADAYACIQSCKTQYGR